MTNGTSDLGLIGFGAIGRAVVDGLARRPVDGLSLGVMLVRPGQVATLSAACPGVLVTDDPDRFVAAGPRVVVEAAGQAAVRDLGRRVAAIGAAFHIISTGALADDGLRGDLIAASRASGGRLILPAGAIAGLDGLIAMREDGLESVTYTSTKPPLAWAGTPAEGAFDLENLTAPVTIFEGPARRAAKDYPRNANLAATVALAGLGLDRTVVRLVADPAARGNAGRIDARSRHSRLRVTVAGESSANPKTSAITAMSILAALRQRGAHLVFD